MDTKWPSVGNEIERQCPTHLASNATRRKNNRLNWRWTLSVILTDRGNAGEPPYHADSAFQTASGTSSKSRPRINILSFFKRPPSLVNIVTWIEDSVSNQVGIENNPGSPVSFRCCGGDYSRGITKNNEEVIYLGRIGVNESSVVNGSGLLCCRWIDLFAHFRRRWRTWRRGATVSGTVGIVSICKSGRQSPEWTTLRRSIVTQCTGNQRTWKGNIVSKWSMRFWWSWSHWDTTQFLPAMHRFTARSRGWKGRSGQNDENYLHCDEAALVFCNRMRETIIEKYLCFAGLLVTSLAMGLYPVPTTVSISSNPGNIS